MRKLRANNTENRENMTIKLTQKLLENKRRGRKIDIDESAKKISLVKGLAKGGNKKTDEDSKMSDDELLD